MVSVKGAGFAVTNLKQITTGKSVFNITETARSGCFEISHMRLSTGVAGLNDAAAGIDAEEISKYLYTAGQPDPELIIRTSGEQRLGGFLLWQSALSEYYFCEAYWPDFRRVDFFRALRAYSLRHRRFGG
jgi:undecaprenyl diphosphate synthase